MIIRRVSSAEKSFPRDLEASVATATVDAQSTVALRRLPRLSDFEARHPDIDVHVDASMPLVDLHDGKVDLAIRYGAGQYAGLRVERLLGEEAIPVCSPALYDGPNPLRRPEDLRHHTLL